MARQVNKLSARTVASLTKPGRHSDGGGLYLSISPNGGRRWVFLFRWRGKPTEMGLGGATAVPLARARELATEARRKIAEGLNPVATRRMAVAIPTFGEGADSLVKSMETGWRNAKHRYQWKMTLEQYAKPLRPIPVDQITTEDVLKVLRPIWTTKSETASRLRGRIERVLDAAKTQGHRTGENPARWRGHLNAVLPARKRLTRGHHPALPYADMPAFMRALREGEAVGVAALEFTILTAARTGETIGARWSEIDFDGKLWTVPPERMKAGIEHRVPLSDQALAIVQKMQRIRCGDFVFPSTSATKPLSGAVMTAVLRRMKRADITVHGFRSTFKDWASETTGFPNEVVEMALAHVIVNKVEAAYRRGALLEKRRALMAAWAGYCGAGSAKVLRIAR